MSFKFYRIWDLEWMLLIMALKSSAPITICFIICMTSEIGRSAEISKRPFDSPIRQNVGLNFEWRFYKNDCNGAETPSFDDSKWVIVDVPHDWSIAGPVDKSNSIDVKDFEKWVRWTKEGSQGYLPRGIGWYRKHLTCPKEYKGKKVFIEFDGVYRNSDVWLNGHHLGNHISGYISFVYDLTPYLNYNGDNVLAVKVDGRKCEEWWYQGRGIYRPVRLLITDMLHVDKWGTFVTTSDIQAGKAVVDIKTTIKNETNQTSNCTLISTIYDTQGNVVGNAETAKQIEAGQSFVFEQQATVLNPTLWSIENPYLYYIFTQVKNGSAIVDSYKTTFGIRTIFFDPTKGFFLNGKSVKIKGADEHDDFAGLGTAIPNRVHIKRVEMLKSVGVNYLRASAHTFSDELLDAADRLGMVMTQETRYFDDSPWGIQMLRDMIHRDRNHPCLILWGLGNEEALEGTEEGTVILRKLHTITHQEDPTRFTYMPQAHNYNKAGYSDITDVLGCNWRGWSDLDSDHASYPKRVNFLSEYNFSVEDWQKVMDREWLAGGGMWSGSTYKGELNWPNNSWPGHIFDMAAYPFRNYWNIKKAFAGINGKPRLTSKGPATRLVLAADRTKLASDGQDVAVVYVTLEDDKGNIVADVYNDPNYYGAALMRSHSDIKVNFSVNGEGKLAGVANADQFTHEVDGADYRSTYLGVCTAVVRAGKVPGKFTLNAKAENGLTASVDFVTEPNVSPYLNQPIVKKLPISSQDQKSFEISGLKPSVIDAHANESLMISSDISNVNSLYPLEVRLLIDGKQTGAEKFAVAIGTTRTIYMSTPKYYEARPYKVVMEYFANRKPVGSKEATFSIRPTPASFEFGSVDTPNYAYAGEQITARTTVINIGTEIALSKQIPLLVNGKKVASETVSVAAGQSRNIEFSVDIPKDMLTCSIAIGESPAKEISVLKPFSAQSGVTIKGNPMKIKGWIGNALKFNGESDYLEIPPIDLKNKAFTISAWVKIDEFYAREDQAALFSGGSESIDNGLHAGVGYRKPFMGFWGDDYYGSQMLSTNKWYFIAYVLESLYVPPQTGLEGAIASYKTAQKVYVNGELDGSRPCNFYKGDLKFIGSFWGKSCFNGVIDDVRVYDRALDENEIVKLYKEPFSIKDKMLLWLNFDDANETANAADNRQSHFIQTNDFKITASSESPWGTPAINLINGSGLNHYGEHDGDYKNMWLSGGKNNGKEWLKIDMGSTYTVNRILIWNYNQSGYTCRSTKNMHIYWSDSQSDPDNGNVFNRSNWKNCTSDTVTLTQASGTDMYHNPDEIKCAPFSARWVYFDINNAYDESGFHDVGLSEIQLFGAMTK